MLAFGLDHVIVRDIDVANPASIRSVSTYALSLGRTSIVTEAGRSRLVLEPDVNVLVEGSLNVPGSLGMLSRVVRPVARATWLGNEARVRADGDSIFLGTVSRDTRVAKGQRIGTITDYWGRKTGEGTAPITGSSRSYAAFRPFGKRPPSSMSRRSSSTRRRHTGNHRPIELPVAGGKDAFPPW